MSATRDEDPYAGKLAQIPSQLDLLAEVERLRAEVRFLGADQRRFEIHRQEAEIGELREQRDTLAELLALVLGALHRCDPADINAADYLPETITARSLMALRKAGR